MKKFILFILIILFIGSVSALVANNSLAMKLSPYTNYNYALVVSDNLNNNRIATVAIDENNIIKSVEILNDDSSKYEAILEPVGNPYFSHKQKIVLSGEYCAIEQNVLKENSKVDTSINVFKINGEEMPLLNISSNPIVSSYFSLYNNYFVTSDIINGKYKIALFNLENSEKKVFFEDDEFIYYSPYIYKQNILASVRNEIYLINIVTQEKERIGEFLGNQREFLIMNDDYISYLTFFNDKKNVVLFNRKTNEQKIIYGFDEDFNLNNLELKNNYLTFSYLDLSNRNVLFLYDIGDDFLQELKTEKHRAQTFFTSPTMTNNRFFWISNSDGEHGKLHYADLNNLFNEDDYLELTKKFLFKESIPDGLRGQILLQVEKNGEAWYVHPKENYIYYLGRPADALSMMQKVGLGISNSDLNKIPISVNNFMNIPKNSNPYNYEICWVDPKEDNDHDCLPNNFEEVVGTDKNKKDTDGDGYGDFDEIKNSYDPNGDRTLPYSINNRIKGYVVLQVEEKGEAWYIDKIEGKRYFLGYPHNALNTLKTVGLGISQDNFNNLFD